MNDSSEQKKKVEPDFSKSIKSNMDKLDAMHKALQKMLEILNQRNNQNNKKNG